MGLKASRHEDGSGEEGGVDCSAVMQGVRKAEQAWGGARYVTLALLSSAGLWTQERLHRAELTLEGCSLCPRCGNALETAPHRY